MHVKPQTIVLFSVYLKRLIRGTNQTINLAVADGQIPRTEQFVIVSERADV